MFLGAVVLVMFAVDCVGDLCGDGAGYSPVSFFGIVAVALLILLAMFIRTRQAKP